MDIGGMGDQYNYKESLSLVNGDSTSHWSYDGDYGRQECSYEHPYGSYGYATKMGSYDQRWLDNCPSHDSYSPYYYLKSNTESDKYMANPSLTTWVGILEESMSLCQAIMSFMSKMFEQILEVI
ncbi:hypothetical protein PVK06_028260 [Gossypium arboreum]|uniref:Uncharacterized protein n=1 Tax=Gossypium arboreum TaxID=29729 RepID=A0ABR0P2H1_GOSAR|nr:hypothetical protein PVK06_028260 [Gossypium arboreum]